MGGMVVVQLIEATVLVYMDMILSSLCWVDHHAALLVDGAKA